MRTVSVWEIDLAGLARSLESRRDWIAQAEGRQPLPAFPASFRMEGSERRPFSRADAAAFARAETADILRRFGWPAVPVVAALLGWLLGFWSRRIPDPRVRAGHLWTVGTSAGLLLWLEGGLLFGGGVAMGAFGWLEAGLHAIPGTFLVAAVVLAWPTWVVIRYPGPRGEARQARAEAFAEPAGA
jgi:hypothetical protein